MMDKLMKALILKPDGSQITLASTEIPIPEPNQVLIKVHVTSITSQDKDQLFKRPSFPTILGIEGSGIIVQDSKSLFSRKHKGKKVSFMQLDESLPGSWAEYVVCDEKYFMVLQENIDFLRGSTLLINPLTVLMMNERIKKAKHKSIIHSNAASDLGIVFIHWCHFSEIKLISIVKTKAEAERISVVVPDLVLTLDSETFREDLKKACQDFKPTCAFDFWSGRVAGEMLNNLEDNGELFLMSGGTTPVEGISPEGLIFKGKSIKGLRFKQWFDDLSILKRAKYFNRIQKINFVFTSTLTNVYPINQFQDALDNYQQLGENLLHFACDLNTKTAKEDIMSQYIPPTLKERINSLPPLEWSGIEYPLKVLNEGIYKGELENEKPTGLGILLEENTYYIGNFEQGFKNGNGRLVSCLFYYEGLFEKNQFHGFGSLKHFNGFQQTGNFFYGELNGEGSEVLPSGEVYNGEFLKNERHGKGEISFAGIKFVGIFQEGLAHGPGEMNFEDGRSFKGNFSKGVGNGEMRMSDGRVVVGTMNGSKFTEQKEKN
jgi:NADPH:quinone reductase-like Zn-dependent oxidoreductase